MGDTKADLAVLVVHGQGGFLLTLTESRIAQIGSTHDWTWLFEGVTPDGEPPPYTFTDYAPAEPTMRSNARREFKIDGKE